MKKNEIYKCSKCGNIIETLWNGERDVICCGEEMSILVPNSGEYLGGDHVPVIRKIGKSIEVELDHPMESEHYILFIELVSSHRCHRVNFVEGDRVARARFTLGDSDEYYIKIYCNRHGLYSTL